MGIGARLRHDTRRDRRRRRGAFRVGVANLLGGEFFEKFTVTEAQKRGGREDIDIKTPSKIKKYSNRR
jgi:hypothetical protein